jgi:NADPH:quinone reductase-like Zn-dependent oxidoreductase
VLIRVRAASVHIGDWHVMTGQPYALRALGFGLRAPNVRVRGMDVAGIVESVGKDVSEFRPGDAVFGTCKGAFAEYACAPAANFARKPTTLSFQQAAAVPTSAFAALQALRDRGGIRQNQKVLIVGAAGGVGIFAVQIAKSLGAHVTAVCSASKFDLARSLGADEVIDYASVQVAEPAARYDLVLDVAGSWKLGLLRRLVTSAGTLVLVGGEGGGRWLGGMGKWLQALAVAPLVGQKLRPLTTMPNKSDLLFISRLIETGSITPVVDRTLALKDVPDAFRYLRTGQAKGKIVITP